MKEPWRTSTPAGKLKNNNNNNPQLYQLTSVPHLHHVEQDFLAQAVLAFEELVLGVRAGDVSADELLTRRRHLQQLRVLILHGHVCGVAQQLPHDGPEMMRDAFPDELL